MSDIQRDPVFPDTREQKCVCTSIQPHFLRVTQKSTTRPHRRLRTHSHERAVTWSLLPTTENHMSAAACRPRPDQFAHTHTNYYRGERLSVLRVHRQVHKLSIPPAGSDPFSSRSTRKVTNDGWEGWITRREVKSHVCGNKVVVEL